MLVSTIEKQCSVHSCNSLLLSELRYCVTRRNFRKFPLIYTNGVHPENGAIVIDL